MKKIFSLFLFFLLLLNILFSEYDDYFNYYKQINIDNFSYIYYIKYKPVMLSKTYEIDLNVIPKKVNIYIDNYKIELEPTSRIFLSKYLLDKIDKKNYFKCLIIEVEGDTENIFSYNPLLIYLPKIEYRSVGDLSNIIKSIKEVGNDECEKRKNIVRNYNIIDIKSNYLEGCFVDISSGYNIICKPTKEFFLNSKKVGLEGYIYYLLAQFLL